jgi:tRNA(Arg) A34 adenosine deaminase TadA
MRMVSKTKYIERALFLASLSEHKNFKHGALLVKRGKVMGEAMNTYTKSPSRHPNYKSEHAEINVMNLISKRPSRDMRGSVMFVARSNSLGSGFSQPCARCENHMRSMGIFKVVYTTSSCGVTQQVLL